RSLASPITRDAQGQVTQAEQLYAPYRVQGNGPPIHLVFRDAPLSNAIGFEYQNSPADEAAADLIGRLRAIQQRQQDTPFLAVIALDGENCWDSYAANGNPFLHSLYGRLLREPELKTVTVSEFIAEFPAQRSLSRIHPGSWINANFDTWVGDAEHNVAWDLLAQARDFLSEREQAADDHEQLASSRREALVAQGSVWFWHDDRNLYLRFDLLPTGRPRPVELEIFFSGSLKQPSSGNFGFDPALRLTAKASGAEVELELRELTPEAQRRQPRWADRASSGEAFAFAVPFEALGHDPGETVEMVAVAHEKGKPVEQLPPTGSIPVRVPG